MMWFLYHVGLLWVLCLSFNVHALWPAPQEYHHGSSIVWVSSDLQMVYEPLQQPLQSTQWLWDTVRGMTGLAQAALGEIPGLERLRIESTSTSNNASQPGPDTSEKAHVSSDHLLQDAFERMKHNLIEKNFVPRKFHPRQADFEPDKDSPDHQVVEIIIIKQVKTIKFASSGYSQNPEAYSIQIEEDGRATIEIISLQGGLHALETFSQLFFAHTQTSAEVYSPYAPLSITDRPNFEHRGLHVDISRNGIPPEDMKRTIEAMAATKLNRLHLHAADVRSWPLEILSLPDLAPKRAYDPSQIWTAADLDAVQHHGFDHGVEVFLEINLLGLTREISHASLNILPTADQEFWRKMDPSAMSDFVTALLTDLLPRTSRYTSKFHLGGSETDANLYNLNITTPFSPADFGIDVQFPFSFFFSLSQFHSMQPIIWEELALKYNLTLPATVTVQTWHSTSALNAVLAKGHKVLFGPKTHWYLDCGLGWYLDPDITYPKRQIKPPYSDPCSPYKNWRRMYSYDPLKGVLPEHRERVLGGEVHLWGELTDSISLDGTLWPRAAAAAEVMWSATSKMPDEGTTRRLAEWRERVVKRGVRAGVVQKEWCLRYKGACTL